MLPSEIEQLFDFPPAQYTEEHRRTFEGFKAALNCGEVRAAEPDAAAKTGWRINAWVKKGILLGFRMGQVGDMSVDRERQPFFDRDTYPVKAVSLASQLRIVPGGSSIRDGAYVGRGVTCMPPMFINAGARNLLLKGERQKFLTEQWPRVAATIQRLGLTPEELLKAAAKHRLSSKTAKEQR